MDKKWIIFLCMGLGVLFILSSLMLVGTTPAQAQCGSQASSCKNCHETQAQDPVNNDGTDWHAQHSFGDFCYVCHSGNNQSTDQAAAHTGMVQPLSDIETSCMGCHPTNALALAQVYADSLGQTVSATSSSPLAESTASTATQSPCGEAGTEVIPVADMVDYSQRYEEVSQGKPLMNTGNIILVVVLVVIVLVGGYLVLKREGLVSISFEDPRQVIHKKDLPADVVKMLPDLSRLTPAAQRALQKMLNKPKDASSLITSLEKARRVGSSMKKREQEKSKE